MKRGTSIVAGAVAALAFTAIELAGRSLARASLLSAAGVNVEAGTVAVAAGVIAALAIVVLQRSGATSLNTLVAVGLLGSLSIGLWAQQSLGARLQSDGFYYFAYLRSLWFDGDVDLANDYRLLGLGDKPHLFTPTPTGHAQSAWSAGPALMAAPFFAAGDLVARAKRAGGADLAVDGTSYPYRQAWCIAGLVWGLAGLFFCFQLARRFASAGGAILGTASTALGSFALWYFVKEPSMAHAPSFAAVAAFCAFWAATRGARLPWQWAALGVLGGVMTAVRWQNALFLAFPAIEWAWALRATAAPDSRPRREAAQAAATFAAAFLLGVLPQLLAWKAIYGAWIAVSPISPEIRWWDSQWRDVLWSARGGLFAWSPVLYVGAIGLAVLWTRDRMAAATAWAVLASMTVLNGAVGDWWAGAAYGGRRFDSTLPLFAVGAAVAVDAAARWVSTHPRTIVLAALALGILGNATLMDLAVREQVELEAPNAMDDVLAGQARTLHRWFGYPPSYPATLPFALRNGVSPADADILWTTRFLTDPTRPYGRVDIGGDDLRAIGRGWHQPEQDRGTTFRWAAREATLRVALDHAAHLRTQVRARPFTPEGAPAQSLTLVVNDAPQPAVPLDRPDWMTVAADVPAHVWRAGINEIRLTFRHAAAPSAVSQSGDRRELAAAVDFVRLSVVP